MLQRDRLALKMVSASPRSNVFMIKLVCLVCLSVSLSVSLREHEPTQAIAILCLYAMRVALVLFAILIPTKSYSVVRVVISNTWVHVVYLTQKPVTINQFHAPQTEEAFRAPTAFPVFFPFLCLKLMEE
ncbi:hypothetical protein V8C37DRAFT_367654 [Trichoderma ceciliae]